LREEGGDATPPRACGPNSERPWRKQTSWLRNGRLRDNKDPAPHRETKAQQQKQSSAETRSSATTGSATTTRHSEPNTFNRYRAKSQPRGSATTGSATARQDSARISTTRLCPTRSSADPRGSATTGHTKALQTRGIADGPSHATVNENQHLSGPWHLDHHPSGITSTPSPQDRIVNRTEVFMVGTGFESSWSKASKPSSSYR
jgi:hypothetical protein